MKIIIDQNEKLHYNYIFIHLSIFKFNLFRRNELSMAARIRCILFPFYQCLLTFFLCFFYIPFIVSAEEKRVGVLYWSSNIAGQVVMSKALEQEAEKINAQSVLSGKPTVKLIIRVAGEGPAGIENQIRQMFELIEEKVDLLIVQPTDNAALAEPLRTANRIGIPVVAYDQYIQGGTLTAYRTSDNYQGGYLDGEYIASLFPKHRKLRIVLVEYPHVSSTVERVNGFLDGLNQMKMKFKVLKSYVAVEPNGGKKAAEGLIHDFPNKGDIDVVFTVNDGGGLALVNELVKQGRTEIKVATIDGDPASVENIRSGKLTVIDSAQFCGPLGAEAMKCAYAVLLGEKTPYHAVIPVFPVNCDTLHLYPGWNGPVPQAFEKPWKSLYPRWNGQMRIIKKTSEKNEIF